MKATDGTTRGRSGSRTSEIVQKNDRPFAWLPLISVSFCLVAFTVAITSMITYVGVCVQHLLDLQSLNESGESFCR